MRKNIGIIGVRGLEVVYSGFETFVRNLIDRSDRSKFYYFLFSRAGYQKKKSNGENFKDIVVSTLSNKYLETPIYGFFSTIYSIFLPLDAVLYLSVANTPFLWLQRFRKRKIIVNVDGLDWKRARWPLFGKIYLKLCEYFTVKFSDIIVCDSKSVLSYYKKRYGFNNIINIAYGAEVKKRKAGTTLTKFNLEKNKYFLFVGRLTPENKVDEFISAFKGIKTNFKCVVMGDSFFENSYKRKLIRISKSDKRIVFTGILKGKSYEEIGSNAFAYIETKSVGGIHPSLLEAMAFGNCIIARNLSEHREALANTGLYYGGRRPVVDLRKKMFLLLKDSKEVHRLGILAKKRAGEKFKWQEVVGKYEDIFNG
ncbi:hypothetical protein A2714_03115 [Candidatus Woesebacteria bacterium RIFCSPHIGHO2_01_FULL_38_9]|uniref:Glycosyl transferase family 1 domain-containing protein n=1 Tax=Candidatus Woesebacteria bacterium RIFCSPHIGHO2_01_FULL_38_9 TaxID=1802492 RepID=A0A1F7Y3Q2_9BACT|nr:MAG: hypothetical protein A2714_03115 [Candidatus Woesebacteria bacterium RIFCSPHIGHO2_01_FULL_38_9]